MHNTHVSEQHGHEHTAIKTQGRHSTESGAQDTLTAATAQSLTQAQGTTRTKRVERIEKSAHNCTFGCAKMIAWSKRERSSRPDPHHFTCSPQRGHTKTISQGSVLFLLLLLHKKCRYYLCIIPRTGRGRASFCPDNIKKIFSISLRKEAG